jgi:hypothetical protein
LFDLRFVAFLFAQKAGSQAEHTGFEIQVDGLDGLGGEPVPIELEARCFLLREGAGDQEKNGS